MMYQLALRLKHVPEAAENHLITHCSANVDSIANAQLTSAGPSPQPTTRSVLAVHAAIRYSRSVGLGVGLVSRAACAKTGETQKEVLEMQTEGLGIWRGDFDCLEQTRDPHKRADLLGISKALAFAKKTILFR